MKYLGHFAPQTKILILEDSIVLLSRKSLEYSAQGDKLIS